MCGNLVEQWLFSHTVNDQLGPLVKAEGGGGGFFYLVPKKLTFSQSVGTVLEMTGPEDVDYVMSNGAI